MCRLQGSVQPPELAQDGDLVIGGIFSFRTGQDYVVNTFQTKPGLRKCKKYVIVTVYLCLVCVFCDVFKALTQRCLSPP